MHNQVEGSLFCKCFPTEAVIFIIFTNITENFMYRYFLIGLLLVCLVVSIQSQPTPPAQPTPPEKTEPAIIVPWLTSLEQGKAKASESGKDILVDFTGSDWCTWCQQLDEEVFSTPLFAEKVPAKYILVKLDFPREKELPKEEQEANEQAARNFQIEGFPTICLLDSTGLLYAKTGYEEGGVENYLAHLDKLADVKVERDALLKKAEQGNAEVKLEALSAVVTLMQEYRADFAYLGIKDQLILADPENKLGKNLKYSNELYAYYMGKAEGAPQAEKEKLQKSAEPYFENIKKYDAESAKNAEIRYIHIPQIAEQYLKTEKWTEAITALEPLLEKNPTGETGQLVYYLYGASHFKAKNYDKAFAYLEQSVEKAPDSELAPRLRMLIMFLKMQVEQEKEEATKQQNTEPSSGNEAPVETPKQPATTPGE